ncbi:preprotein translocase subunit YajC [Verrucomicrobiales bacterium]|nr:preprotein translocase subunit YajC [Verrucomicrobiales bacterium]
MIIPSLSSFLVAAASQQPGGSMTPLIMMVLMFVIMYFLIIRPQKLRQKELEARIAQVKSGDKIVTTSGIHGLVTNVKEKTFKVKVDANTKLEMEKAAIATIIPKGDAGSKSDEAEETSEDDENAESA